MAMPATLPRYTPEEYLALERDADYRSELVDGQIVAMAGASRNHNRVTFEVGRQLGNQLAGGDCETYSGDMRVRIPAQDTYFYPDILVVCGAEQVEDEHDDTILNPTVIVEVRSPSTALRDRTTKLANYSLVPTLTDYLLVAQDKPQVEHYTRPDAASDWDVAIVSGLDGVVALRSIGCTLALAEVYRRVTFA